MAKKLKRSKKVSKAKPSLKDKLREGAKKPDRRKKAAKKGK